jgi:two-component system response regulator AtoC
MRSPVGPRRHSFLHQQDQSARLREARASTRPAYTGSVSSEPGYQVVVFSREEIRAYDLPTSGEVTIGRDEASTICLDDAAVSRRHAILRLGEAVEIEDLGGTNGTFVRQTAQAGPGNDTVHVNIRQLVRRKANLAVGDCLLFGTAFVVLRHAPRMELPDLAPGVVVRDPAMRTLYAEAARVARASINVLLLGETGVGKEVFARSIHAHSPRASGPFMGINCGALAESLLESELFGSEKGAFTGAVARSGLFEAANGGTVFLDEVGELPLGTQVKLLRVLEERVVTRLGSTRPRPIDVRVLAATNRDVEADSRQGRLRPDLYFRLNGVALLIPPLRERPRELEALAGSFLSATCRDLERVPALKFSAAALEALRQHTWPGNVRELRNAVERAAVMCTESTILPEHLPPGLLAAIRVPQTRTAVVEPSGPSTAATAAPPGGSLQSEMRALERTRILETLERCGGNQSEAARQLGMPRRTLVSRLGDLGVRRGRS